MDIEDLEKRIVKDCPQCNSRVKFEIGDKTAKCKICKRQYQVVYDSSKDKKDPESYSLVYNETFVDSMGKILLVFMIITSIALIGFAIYAKGQLTSGEENTGEYILGN